VHDTPLRRVVNPLAGQQVPPELLVDVPRLMTAYFSLLPDAEIAAQRVTFGTSGHRGSAFATGFNEAHVATITQAICLYRQHAGIDGPLFLGIDTHALSQAAFATAIEVLAANGVETMVDAAGGYTPTPVISHAILRHNRQRASGFADGIVITPSHNPPEDGGIKYNATNGGPAGSLVTGWIETTANKLLAQGLRDVQRMPYARARKAASVHHHDYVTPYVADLGDVIDMAAIADAGIRIGIDPLGGAAVHFWPRIIDHYRIDATVVNSFVDPAFAFMNLDWDGKVRMDCSSPYAMSHLVALRDRFDITFANDTDADRHGIVCPSLGLIPANTYLVAAIAYLCANRPAWPQAGAIGKTMVSSAMIDRLAADIGRAVFEVPVGFKWFSAGLFDGSLVFAGEESAGASFLRRDGTVWTTDKDGLIMGLLAAEITVRTRMDPARYHASVTQDLGTSHYVRTDAPTTAEQRRRLQTLAPADIGANRLAGESIIATIDRAPGNAEPLGGIKVTARDCWFAVRPSGTENVYKLYAESFRSDAQLALIQDESCQLMAGLLSRS
jgi:phosphoglucomutase